MVKNRSLWCNFSKFFLNWPKYFVFSQILDPSGHRLSRWPLHCFVHPTVSFTTINLTNLGIIVLFRFTDWLQAYTYDSLASFSENNDEEQSKKTDSEAQVKEQINSINKKMKRMSRQNEEQADIMKKILEILNGVSSETAPSPATSRPSSAAPLIRLNDSSASPSPVDKMIKSTIFEE